MESIGIIGVIPKPSTLKVDYIWLLYHRHHPVRALSLQGWPGLSRRTDSPTVSSHHAGLRHGSGVSNITVSYGLF